MIALLNSTMTNVKEQQGNFNMSAKLLTVLKNTTFLLVHARIILLSPNFKIES